MYLWDWGFFEYAIFLVGATLKKLYAFFFGQRDLLNISVKCIMTMECSKCVKRGKRTVEIVDFYLEPEYRTRTEVLYQLEMSSSLHVYTT